jgi:hypothetical protein
MVEAFTGDAFASVGFAATASELAPDAAGCDGGSLRGRSDWVPASAPAASTLATVSGADAVGAVG